MGIITTVIMAYQFDDIQKALNEIMPVTPLRPLSWDEKLNEDVYEGYNTFDLGLLFNDGDDDQFYQLCKTRMSPEEYLTKTTYQLENMNDFDLARPDSTMYQIFLNLKITSSEQVFSNYNRNFSKQAVWDTIVYSKIYQKMDICYQVITILSHDLLKQIYPYIPDKIRTSINVRMEELSNYDHDSRIFTGFTEEEIKAIWDSWRALR